MTKILITIPCEYDFEPTNYTTVYDEDGNQVTLTPEQQSALTPEQMLEYDRLLVIHGQFTLEEFIGYTIYDNADVKFELADDDRPVHHG